MVDMISSTFVVSGFGLGMRIVGPFFVLALYFLLGLHVYAYFKVILVSLKALIGVPMTLIWAGIGLTLVYNILFNHFLAVIIKPGSPGDLKRVEKLRMELKNRENRKAMKGENRTNVGDLSVTVEDDRFEGISN